MNDSKMDKKIWLITGISSGLGKALAQAVMANGDFVIGTLRQPAQVEAFNRDHDGKGKAMLLDVTDHEAVEKAVAGIKDHFPRVDVLVNNAGVGFIGAVEESSLEEIRQGI
jgi:NADP-dependent 3-hydroxy acid dehydrogenase YdfG